jgi:hypothetical protein
MEFRRWRGNGWFLVGVCADGNEEDGNEEIINRLAKESKRLKGKLEDTPTIKISKAEKSKRNFQGKTNYASKEDKKTASKFLANVYKEEVESAALKANPQLASKFKEEKQIYGLLQPIQKAAQRRALVTQQSPVGGATDIVLEGVSKFPGASIARRLISPRVASSIAVTEDKLAKAIKGAPGLIGKKSKKAGEKTTRGLLPLFVGDSVKKEEE